MNTDGKQCEIREQKAKTGNQIIDYRLQNAKCKVKRKLLVRFSGLKAVGSKL
jgi:hypothetical protein